MTIDKAKLKALAEKGAANGNWLECPATDVAALLAEIERLEGCEEVLRNLASYAGYEGYDTAAVDHVGFARQIMEGIKILNDPLAQLAEKRGAERDQLKAEVQALRKDAERYRWLRDKQTLIWLIQDWFPSDAAFTDVDGEISAAMAKEASHG